MANCPNCGADGQYEEEYASRFSADSDAELNLIWFDAEVQDYVCEECYEK